MTARLVNCSRVRRGPVWLMIHAYWSDHPPLRRCISIYQGEFINLVPFPFSYSNPPPRHWLPTETSQVLYVSQTTEIGLTMALLPHPDISWINFAFLRRLECCEVRTEWGKVFKKMDNLVGLVFPKGKITPRKEFQDKYQFEWSVYICFSFFPTGWRVTQKY